MTVYGPGPASQNFVEKAEEELLQPDFCIWAEENNSLENNAFEWAYGNGDDTRNGAGIAILRNSELVGMSTDAEGGVIIEARINGNSAGVSIDRSQGNIIEFPLPVQYQAGDIFNFRTLNNLGANGAGTRVIAWFRFT